MVASTIYENTWGLKTMTVENAAKKENSKIHEYIDRIIVFLDIEYGLPVVFERNGETALFHAKRSIVEGDFIIVDNRVTLERQLYLLLHETGHVLLRECEVEHERRYPAAVLKGKRVTRAHKIDILREEVMAWEKGLEIASDFQIPINDKLWHSMVTSALYKYLQWSTNA